MMAICAVIDHGDMWCIQVCESAGVCVEKQWGVTFCLDICSAPLRRIVSCV